MQDIHDGFALCQPCGIWARLSITENNGSRIVLGNGTVFQSKALASMLKESTGIWLAATTVGPEIMEAISGKLAQSDGKAALIYDAVGGETADEAMDYLQAYVNKTLSRTGEKLTKRRFSAGYSDLELAAQRDIFHILKLEDWGLSLTDSMLMIPEKSVTAIAGIESAV